MTYENLLGDSSVIF